MNEGTREALNGLFNFFEHCFDAYLGPKSRIQNYFQRRMNDGKLDLLYESIRIN